MKQSEHFHSTEFDRRCFESSLSPVARHEFLIDIQSLQEKGFLAHALKKTHRCFAESTPKKGPMCAHAGFQTTSDTA